MRAAPYWAVLLGLLLLLNSGGQLHASQMYHHLWLQGCELRTVLSGPSRIFVRPLGALRA